MTEKTAMWSKNIPSKGITPRELMSTADYDLTALIESELGAESIPNFEPLLASDDELAEEVRAYWSARDVKKEIMPTDPKWSLYTPKAAEGVKSPFLFIMSEGKDIFEMESYGIIQKATDRGWLVSGFQACEPDVFIAIMKQMITVCPTDLSHIYIAGFAGGAECADKIAMAYPEMFAAVAAMGIDLVPNGEQPAADRIEKMPTIAVYAAAEPRDVTFGDTVRVVGLDGVPNYPLMNSADLILEFFDGASRDPETGKVIIKK